MRIASSKSYKNIRLGCSLAQAKKQLGLIYVKGSDGFTYSISNKKYLTIGGFNFFKGEAWFLFNRLKYIILESNSSGSAFFKNVLDYFTELFGTPVNKENSYYWIGTNLSYSLYRNKINNRTTISINEVNVTNY